MLGLGIVNRDNRVREDAVLRHCPQANNPGGSFFRAADDVLDQLPLFGVDNTDRVRAVVHREVRLVFQSA